MLLGINNEVPMNIFRYLLLIVGLCLPFSAFAMNAPFFNFNGAAPSHAKNGTKRTAGDQGEGSAKKKARTDEFSFAEKYGPPSNGQNQAPVDDDDTQMTTAGGTPQSSNSSHESSSSGTDSAPMEDEEDDANDMKILIALYECLSENCPLGSESSIFQRIVNHIASWDAKRLSRVGRKLSNEYPQIAAKLEKDLGLNF